MYNGFYKIVWSALIMLRFVGDAARTRSHILKGSNDGLVLRHPSALLEYAEPPEVEVVLDV